MAHMTEGWQGDDYLILFDETESAEYSRRYELGRYLAHARILGLKGWDDFIVATRACEMATVPTIPIDPARLKPLELSIDRRALKPDTRLRGKVKWYITPIIFGGNPLDERNTMWVSFEQHVQLVNWWNDRYQRMK